MSVHTHTMRNWCATALVLVPAPLLLGWGSAPEAKDLKLAQVSGRVSCANQPFSGTIYFLPDNERGPIAIGPVNSDGSFQLYVNGERDLRGAVPGTYRVVVRPCEPDRTGSYLDSKYQHPRTTDLIVHLKPDWNYVSFNLH